MAESVFHNEINILMQRSSYIENWFSCATLWTQFRQQFGRLNSSFVLIRNAVKADSLLHLHSNDSRIVVCRIKEENSELYLSADTCKKNRKTSSLSDFSQSPHGRDHIAHNENTSPVVHKHHNVIPFTGQCGRENLARTTSVAQVYSSSPWFSWAVKSLSGWHEESVRCGVLCHCHAHSCCQQDSQETFIVQTVWRWKLLNGDTHPVRLFGIQTDTNFHLYCLKFRPCITAVKNNI